VLSPPALRGPGLIRSSTPLLGPRVGRPPSKLMGLRPTTEPPSKVNSMSKVRLVTQQRNENITATI